VAEPAPARRLVSLDAFRGATVAAMILVNNPGSWNHVYPPLEHAAWHGWTPTDLIVPFFLFIVGVSLTLSRRVAPREAAWRALKILGLGLLLAAWPTFALGTLRWLGVLPRIALCYLAAFLLARWLGERALAGIAAALLVGYWALMTLVPVPDGHPPNLDAGTNLAAWVDRALMGGHLWKQTKTWDPEGLLSTLPAIATTLIGVLSGRWLRRPREPRATLRQGLLAGLALTALGLLWDQAFPINKSLWTSSYVLFTGGLALCALTLCHWLVDLRGLAAWAGPCVTYGRNAIFVFVASGLLAKTLARVQVTIETSAVPLQRLLHETLLASWLPPRPASLAWALLNVLGFYFVLRALEKRGIFFRV
jgi:predicted acyltransferase